MFQELVDYECRRCKAIYQNNDRKFSVLYGNCYLSVCNKCTAEIADMMGFTKDNLLKELSLIKEAETENNKKRRLENGTVCNKCGNKFAEGDARVREGSSSNIESWHLNCYEK